MRKILEYLLILIALPFAVITFYCSIMLSLIMWDSSYFGDDTVFDKLLKK